MRVIVLVLLFSCRLGPQPLCVTTCGIETWELPKGWTCDGIQQAETLALAAYKHTKDARLLDCAAAYGYHLEIQTLPWWRELDGAEVSGRTYCAIKTFKVNTSIAQNATPNQSSFAHELVHILQECSPLPDWRPCVWPDLASCEYHSNWDRDGIWQAILEVKENGQ